MACWCALWWVPSKLEIIGIQRVGAFALDYRLGTQLYDIGWNIWRYR